MDDAVGSITLSIVLKCGNPGPNPMPKGKKSKRQTALSERLCITTIDAPHTCRLMGGVCGCRQWFEQLEKKSVASRWISCSELTPCEDHKHYDFLVTVKQGVITVHFKHKRAEADAEPQSNEDENFDRRGSGKKQHNTVKGISWVTPEQIAQLIKKDGRVINQKIKINRDGYFYLKFTLLFAVDNSENLILYASNCRRLELFYKRLVELMEDGEKHERD